jgi:hypothetical protein
MTIKIPFLFAFLVLYSFIANAQFNSYFDPALAYNKVLLEKGNRGTYLNVGAFRVVGSPYIYGEAVKGDVYHNGTIAKNIEFRINNHTKELQLATQEAGKYFLVSIDDLDSLTLFASQNEYINSDLTFISSKFVGGKQKCFLQQLQKGPRFTLYKSYDTELAIPSDNYIQSELREFKLDVVYYYTDTQMPGELISIKANKKSLNKAFKDTNAAEVLDNVNLTGNLDLALTKFFSFLK